jgi:periplasmic divalent cation tolerance protein
LIAVSVLLAFCTVPNDEVAAELARSLVEERLAACVQAMPGVASTYRWQGAVHTHAEVLLLIKTTRERFGALKSRLPDLHPYELPELIALDAVDGLDRYLHWVGSETQ